MSADENATLLQLAEATYVVVQTWGEVRDRPNARWPVPIVGALDALTAAYDSRLRHVIDTPDAPVDWPARFRAAAKEAACRHIGRWLSRDLLTAADRLDQLPPDVVEAIGRALLGEAS